jgi:type I restriction enzyme M protein
MSSDVLAKRIWDACDILRRDDNCKLITKYIEHLSWLLFLKSYEAFEQENEAAVPGYAHVIDAEHTWSAWTAATRDAEDLVEYVASDLWPYLRGLDEGPEARLVATIFSGVTALCKSGYNLKDVIDEVSKIDFHASGDVLTVSVVYESLLARLGEAGASGEHYTPRPIVRLMVQQIAPSIGETIYDPACGSAGFLVESYQHLLPHERTVDDRDVLQSKTFLGQENGELPFLLGIMNMLLHGVSSPNIRRTNTLEQDIRTIAAEEKVDIVVTNPPFGGRENRAVQQNFPIRSSATEILFVQHVIASLKVAGRCAIVVPDGLLFDDDGAFKAVRRQLVTECNLHTIIRLPPGTFPYTPHQKLNLLFFDRQGPTEAIWFYEHPVPEARRHLKHPRYTKTQPLRFEEFMPIQEWWNDRQETEWAWRVSVGDLDSESVLLDLRHPLRPLPDPVVSPEIVVAETADAVSALEHYGQSLRAVTSAVDAALDTVPEYLSLLDAGVTINPENTDPRASPDTPFTYVDLSAVDRGAISAPDDGQILGKDAPSRARRVVRADDVLFATVRPYLRGHAVIPPELDLAVASTGFAVLRPPPGMNAHYLLLAMMSSGVVRQCFEAMRGAHYPAVRQRVVEGLRIPVVGNELRQIEIVDLLWPELEALRDQRVSVTEVLSDLLDTLKDSEFALLSGAAFDET